MLPIVNIERTDATSSAAAMQIDFYWYSRFTEVPLIGISNR